MLQVKEEITMTHKIQVLAAIAAITITAGIARAQNSMNPGINHAQLEQMLRSAHTVEQYQMLASYFHARQVVFEEKAQSEKQEWDRRSQITAASYQKYPRPADSSRNRYEYFTAEAQEMGDQAAHYDSLSTSAK
jgi:hypothetical protein